MKTLIFLALCLVAFSCTNETSDQSEETVEVSPAVQEFHDEVIAVHDEVMPRMGELMALRTSIESAADSLEGPAHDSLMQVAGRLGKADEAMMSWMRQFRPMLEASDSAAAMAYYREELVKVKEVRRLMLHALEEGDSVVKNL